MKCPHCERCTWNKGPDCGIAEHPHCERCGHCSGRHGGLRVVEYTETYEIRGRGTVYASTHPDPSYEVGEYVVIDGKAHRITGLEEFRDMGGHDPGRHVGVMGKPL